VPVPAALDHLVYATPNLADGIRQITQSFGVSPLPGGIHPGWGTRNAIVPLSPTTYLEVIGPDSESPIQPVVFGLATLQKSRLVTWAAKGRRLAELVAGAQGFGLQLGTAMPGRRQRPDGAMLSWELTDPSPLVGDGLIPFFIDWGHSPHPAMAHPAQIGLLHLQASHPNPDLLLPALRRLDLDLDLRPGPQVGLRAILATPRGQMTLD